MHVKAFHPDVVGLDYPQHVPELVDGDAEFRINVAGLDVGIPPAYQMRINPQANWHLVAVLVAEFLQDGNVVNIDVNTLFDAPFYFIEGHTVGRKKDGFGVKTGFKAQFNFLDGNGIQACPNAFEQLQDGQVGIGLAGIFDFQISVGKSLLKPVVLVYDLVGIVNIKGGIVGIDNIIDHHPTNLVRIFVKFHLGFVQGILK